MKGLFAVAMMNQGGASGSIGGRTCDKPKTGSCGDAHLPQLRAYRLGRAKGYGINSIGWRVSSVYPVR